MKKNYLIDYIVYSNDNSILKKGIMRAKNARSKLEAQIQLEIFFKKKYDNFGRLVVNSCDDDILYYFNDIFEF